MVQTTCDVLFFKSKLQIEYIPYLATEWSRRQIKIINWLPFRILILCYFSQVSKNFLVSTFLVNHIFPSKYMFTCCYPAGKYWSPESPEEVPSNVPRTSPKHPIWPSRGRYHLTFWGSPDLTSQGRRESTSRGCILVGVPRRSQYLQRTS